MKEEENKNEKKTSKTTKQYGQTGVDMRQQIHSTNWALYSPGSVTVDQECDDNNINETGAKIPYLKLKDLNGERLLGNSTN